MNPIELLGPMVFGLLVYYYAGRRIAEMLYTIRFSNESSQHPLAIGQVAAIAIEIVFWVVILRTAFEFVYEAAYKSGVIDAVIGIDVGAIFFGRGGGAYFLVGLALLAGICSAGITTHKATRVQLA